MIPSQAISHQGWSHVFQHFTVPAEGECGPDFSKGLSLDQVFLHPHCPVGVWWYYAKAYPLRATQTALYPLLLLEDPLRWRTLLEKKVSSWISLFIEDTAYISIGVKRAVCERACFRAFEHGQRMYPFLDSRKVIQAYQEGHTALAKERALSLLEESSPVLPSFLIAFVRLIRIEERENSFLDMRECLWDCESAVSLAEEKIRQWNDIVELAVSCLPLPEVSNV